MGRVIKTIEQKLQTKLIKISDANIKVTKKQVRVGNNILFKYSSDEVSYTKTRYFPRLKDEIVEDDYSVTILLDVNTLGLLSSNICKPPKKAKVVLGMFRDVRPDIDKIVIGGDQCKIQDNVLYITYDLYSILLSVDKEEGVDRKIRVKSRIAPFLKDNFNLKIDVVDGDRDYALLLREIIADKKISQTDIVALTNELEGGDNNEIVIKKQINKQVDWLLGAMQSIIDLPKITKEDAKNFGSSLFNFPKTSISGPEDLMEKILTKYGQNIIFGVPALLNTNKYVISMDGFPKCQFDIVLINYLSDIEIVELKRPDEYLFDYDPSRAKFYMCKALSVATAQSERYISTLYKEKNPDIKINGKNIKEYIESQFGGTITLSICRPKALIIIGTIDKLAIKYDDLPIKEQAKVTKRSYNQNLNTAYKELKSSFKNIEITTYTEIIEGARLRSQLESD